MKKIGKKTMAVLLSLVMFLSCFTGMPAVMKTEAADTEENIALNKPTMGTAGNSGRAVDGDISTYWDGGVVPSQLIVDLESYYALNKIVVIPYYGGTRYYHYEVYGSVDGVTYDLLGEKSENTPETSAGKSFSVDGTVYRYVKVNMTYNSANPSAHINELRVYGTEDPEFTAPTAPDTDENDPGNLAFGKPTRSTTNNQWTMLAVDGNTQSAWAGEDYPKYVDVDLLANYDIREIKVYMPTLTDTDGERVKFAYTVYGSLDGSDFQRIAESGLKAPAEEGDSYTFDTPLNYRVIRVNVTANSKGEGANSMVSEIKIYGEKNSTAVTETRADIEFGSYEDWLQENYGVDVAGIKDAGGHYSMKDTYTEADVFETVRGVITRILGEEYVEWFTFELAERGDGKDYYEISNDPDGKIHIKGNEGLSITTGLNHYLKYYCNVHVSQQTSQVRMPEAIVPVTGTVTKASPYETRYAYNYCTLSYTMPFWGYDEWQRELDYFALNGVNLVLDTTATEALWVKYLLNYGYDVDEAKAFVCGYSYKAWWLMGNLESYGGPVGDQWILDTVEMARHNQRFMTVLGMQPCLQGFMGALPEHFAETANETLMGRGYSDIREYMVEQGDWSGFTRPPILKTTYDGYTDMAAKFYETQEYIYGQITDYYAGDLAHEGGVIPPDLSKAEMSAFILQQMMTYDSSAVWVIQSWLSNPNSEILEGFGENREDHVLVLDLDATENPHWSNTTNWNGKEFGGTSWVFCMLDNYGGRTGMHGELLYLAKQIAYANAHSEHMKGIGITPEGTQLNPVNYDLFWEMGWEDEAMDLDQWLKDYITRRYGEYSENVYEGWKLLLETAYGYCNADGTYQYHAGNNNCIINMRPSFNPTIVIGDYAIPYDTETFEKGADLILSEFDRFKDNECYIYDAVDLLRQVVANTEVAYFEKIVEAYHAGEYRIFSKYKKKLLDSILLLDEISSYQVDSLAGTWIGRARNFYNDERTGEYDDYSKDMMEINAKAIVSIWSSKTLQTYGHRQYSGMLADYNYPMWECWLDAVDTAMQTGTYEAPTSGQDYFNFGWNYVINGKDYPTVPSNVDGDENSRGLKEIYGEVYTSYLSGQIVKDTIINDNVALNGTAYAQTSLSKNSQGRINDGDAGNLWIAGSSSVPVYCGITFEDYVDVYGMQVTAETRPTLGANVMQYRIEGLDENDNWVELYSGNTYDEEAQSYTTNIVLDKITKVKDVRLTFTTNGGIYPALAEFKIYSSSGILLVPGQGLSVSNGVLEGVDSGLTVAQLQEYLYYGQGDLVFTDPEGNVMDENAIVVSGTKVQLVFDGLVLDEYAIREGTLDTAELSEAIAEIESMDLSGYTEETLQTLAEALAEAKEVLTNAVATQAQADAAVEKLAEAKAGLQTIKEAMEQALAQANEAAERAEAARAAAAEQAADAAEAKEAAESAKAEAAEAQAAAETGRAAAEAARAAAEAAQAEAEKQAAQSGTSKEAAEAAEAKAESARLAAEAAQMKAEAARLAAEAAQMKAEAAQKKAETAQGAAETAQQYAEAARLAAEAAKAAAEADAEDAARANAEAQEALKKAETARTAAEAAKVAAETAKKEAEEIVAAAETAKAAAEAAKAAAETALRAAEAAQKAAEAEVQKAKAETEKAKLEVENAKAEAEKAKLEVENAKAEAERAKAEAAQAKAEAQKALEASQAAAAAAKEAQGALQEFKSLQSAAKVTITANKKKYTVKRGKKVKIKAKASDGSRLTFKSSNKKVVTVTSKGVVRGRKKGKAFITIRAGQVKKKVRVIVK